jgi:hypothetical protein
VGTVSRRVKLPGADELFRATPQPAPDPVEVRTEPEPEPARKPRSTGRVKHDEKMTVYISADELMHLEQARLALRRQLGGAVDRGRLVREAVAIVLADFEERGAESDLVRRLSSS